MTDEKVHEAIAIELTNGNYIIAQSFEDNPDGVDFIGVASPEGNIMYFITHEEWESNPKAAIGGFIGCLVSDEEQMDIITSTLDDINDLPEKEE